MSQLAPPSPPLRVALADEGGVNRLRARLWFISATALTVLITAWCCTLGALPAIIALVVAKHVLVALLVMGLNLDAERPPESEQAWKISADEPS